MGVPPPPGSQGRVQDFPEGLLEGLQKLKCRAHPRLVPINETNKKLLHGSFLFFELHRSGPLVKLLDALQRASQNVFWKAFSKAKDILEGDLYFKRPYGAIHSPHKAFRSLSKTS